MKAIIQKEIVKKPIVPQGEDINGCMESVTITIKILGVVLFKEVIWLL